MKRTTLVRYSSSEDEKQDDPVVVKKKRNLPSLPMSLVPAPPPVDDPSLHQGRIRTTPHREGQFAAYVYVAVPLKTHSPSSSSSSSLRVLVDEILSRARELAPTINYSFCDRVVFDAGAKNDNTARECGPGSAREEDEELHVSLSRPTYLHAHQRDEFKRAVKSVATRHSPFHMSFATVAELTNDEYTRTFLTLEVGAGHNEFKRMSDALTPALNALRQKEFYANPRFHASIGWALLDSPAHPGSASLPLPAAMSTPTSGPAGRSSPPSQAGKPFPTIPHFPPTLVPTLNDEFGPRLASAAKLGMSGVEDICLKVGKDVFKWPLLGK